MRLLSFIECYQDWKLTGNNDVYSCGQDYLSFDINAELLIYMNSCINIGELYELIKYIIRDTTRKIILVGNGDNIEKLNLNINFYNYTFTNIDNNAVLINKSLI